MVRAKTFGWLAALFFYGMTVSQSYSYAQSANSNERATVQLRVNESDRAGASSRSNFFVRLRPVSKPGQTHAVSSRVSGDPLRRAAEPDVAPQGSTGEASLLPLPAPGFYPADLAYNGGKVLKSATSNLVLIDHPATEWGSPGIFLTNLEKSDFIHVIDQYVGESADDRYSVGTRFAFALSDIRHPGRQ